MFAAAEASGRARLWFSPDGDWCTRKNRIISADASGRDRRGFPGLQRRGCSGAGAAALACLDHLVALGLRRERIFVADIAGVVYRGEWPDGDE